jgi:hypothetical protein
MSEHLLKFLLTELSIVRVVCAKPGCGGVVEVLLEQLGKVIECPVCQADLRDHHAHMPEDKKPGVFAALAEALRMAQSLQGQARVEFVLPAKQNAGS